MIICLGQGLLSGSSELIFTRLNFINEILVGSILAPDKDLAVSPEHITGYVLDSPYPAFQRTGARTLSGSRASLFAPLTLRSKGITLYLFIEHISFYVLEGVRTFLRAHNVLCARQSLDLLGQLYLSDFKHFVKIAYLNFLFLKIKNQRVLTFGLPPKPPISFWFEQQLQ